MYSLFRNGERMSWNAFEVAGRSSGGTQCTILQGVTTGILFVGGDREERNILKILVGIRREKGQIIVNYHMRML